MTQGEYYLGIIADVNDAVGEATNADNALASSSTILIEGASTLLPDLVPTIVGAPTSAVSGQTITMTVSVTNHGGDMSSAYILDGYVYLSSSSSDLTGGTYLGNIRFGEGGGTRLYENGSLQFAGTVTIPGGLPGRLYYLVYDLDPNDYLVEGGDPGNNTTAVIVRVN